MLNRLSWSEFWIWLVTLAGIYYLVIVLVFYRKGYGLLSFLKKKNDRGSPDIIGPPEQK